MWIVYFLIPAAVVGLVFLLAILPRRRRNVSPFDRVPYAHRGLHSGDSAVPENSLAAFRRAREAGYGVELDVQFSADRQIVVFHDDNLKRMCGLDRRVDELTYDELRQLRLLGSDQYIPLLSEVLTELDGTPLLCEFKAMRSYTDASLCAATLPLLQSYKGLVCIESFNPFMVGWFQKNAPAIVRGILSKRFEKGDVIPILRGFLSSLMGNFLCRPDFIAYQHTDRSQPFFRLCRLFGAMTMAWTVRSAAEEATAREVFDTVIFESYLPSLPEK